MAGCWISTSGSSRHISRRTTEFVEIVRALRCGTARAGGQPVRGVSSPPPPFAGWLIEASRQRAVKKRRVFTRPRALPWVGENESPWGQLPRRFPAVESIPALPRPSPFARRVEAGLGRRFTGAGSPDPVMVGRRTTRDVRRVSRVGLYATFAHAGSGACRPVRFCPRAHGALAPETVPLAGVGTPKIPTQQNAPKQRVLCEEQSFTRCAHAL